MADDSYRAPDKQCAAEGCDRTFRDHQWGQTKAHNEGWFHQRDGRSWCPEHTPEWVAEWRARRS